MYLDDLDLFLKSWFFAVDSLVAGIAQAIWTLRGFQHHNAQIIE
jgi:hypothetical protein